MTAAAVERITTVTITEDSVVAVNHAAKTGICIAVSTAVQFAARMLNEADCLEEVHIDPEVPLFRIRVKGHRRAYARSTFAALTSILREIQQLNPALLDIVERQ